MTGCGGRWCIWYHPIVINPRSRLIQKLILWLIATGDRFIKTIYSLPGSNAQLSMRLT
ncbi:hypothetical protein [Nostoc sp. CMAA1605]|uniref:hypothetical protein n=1 Tax=Nostoc sp. CMAA1605 TaxID=2055159 RepID=UPI001F4415CD|nr:hypothetical protein [Nostoc sp. CMAA1605]